MICLQRKLPSTMHFSSCISAVCQAAQSLRSFSTTCAGGWPSCSKSAPAMANSDPSFCSSAEAAMVNPENPWLGLYPYGTEHAAYFHGREAEVEELLRRVRQKVLTVLFGESGLGKSSLLKAGLFPQLQTEGM